MQETDGPAGGGRVTLSDVAAAAGVSAATVSRTLTREQSVKSQTRKRVLRAVEKLGYEPNLAARGLITGRTLTLAILVPDVANPFFAALVQAAQHQGRSAGQMILIGDTRRDPEDELKLVRSLCGHADGIVVCSPVNPVESLELAARGKQLVFVNRRVEGSAAVVVDQRGIVDRAVDHLRKLGHRHLAYLGGPDHYWSSQQRVVAIEALRVDGSIEVLGPFAPTFDGGRQAASVALATQATGYLAFNDLMALGVLAELSSRGVAVPAQRSVVGSDDVPMAAMVTPALTTVAAPIQTLGRAAIDLVLERIETGGSEPPRRVEFEGALVERESTAAPPDEGIEGER